MSRKAVSMRKIRELLRLQSLGLGQRQIARSLNLSVGVVHKYLNLSKKTCLTSESVKAWTDDQLRDHLQGNFTEVKFVEPDYAKVDNELQIKGVTLKLLHKEYLKAPSSTNLHLYGYSQFCNLYRHWKKKQTVTLRQCHEPGTAFIDYAGPKVTLKNPVSQVTIEVPIFIMVLGISQYTYLEATLDQSLPNWINSHVRAFQYFDGVPSLLVPDNTKTAVSQACYYDPDLNPTYAEFAAHYHTAVMPARPYHPRDKAKVENSVLLVERWILARLRHQVFTNLEDLNQALKGLLKELNAKPFQKQPGNRGEKFQQQEASFLKPLPLKAYEVATFKKLKVPSDYHLLIEHHAYSVPYAWVGETVEIRLTAHLIEIFHHGQRIASHKRQIGPGTTTVTSHQSPNHVHHQLWTLETALSWAQGIGQSTQLFLAERFRHHHHRQQQYRYFLGLSKLARQFGAKRLEAVCKRASDYGVSRYKQLYNLLEKGFDQIALPKKLPDRLPIAHENIRGASYYSNQNGDNQ